jgi:rare lipoprotein A
MNYKEKGFAAWYSRDSQNRLTTNGEVFDDEKMTAAHKTLPLPSLVRITNLENGNTAIVRVNDRGPAVNNRLMDVSRKVAEALEMQINGTTFVEVEVLPDESRRLKEGLEEYIEPKAETLQDELLQDNENRPIYQNDTPETMPIYENKSESELVEENDASLIEVDTLPPIGTETGLDVEPIQMEEVQPKIKAVIPEIYKIQAGAFGNKANLKHAIETLEKIGTVETEEKGSVTIVRVVGDKNKVNEKVLLDKIRQAGYKDAWIKK